MELLNVIHKTVLHYAVEMKYIEIIKILLAYKNTDVNVKDSIYIFKLYQIKNLI